MTSSPPTLSGFNNNVRYRGMRFHIQTEDSGITRPHITTHLFADGGCVIKSLRTDYAEYVGHPERASLVHRMMREQHRAVALELRDGKLDATIERITPGLAPVDPLASATASGVTSPASASGTRPLVTTADVAALVPPTHPPSEAAEALSAEPAAESATTEAVPDTSESGNPGSPSADGTESGEPLSSDPPPSSQPPSSRTPSLRPGNKRRGSSSKQPNDRPVVSADAPPSSRRSTSRRPVADREAPESSQRPSSRRAANGAKERAPSSRQPASLARPPSNRKPTALARAASRHINGVEKVNGAEKANGSAEKPASSKNGRLSHAASHLEGSRRPASSRAGSQRPPSSAKSNGGANGASHPPSSRNGTAHRAPSSRQPSSSARPPSGRGAATVGNKRSSSALSPSKPPSSRGSRRAGRPSAGLPVQPNGVSLFGPMPQDSLDDAILTYVARAKNGPPPRGTK
jgi:hypothetical protein